MMRKSWSRGASIVSAVALGVVLTILLSAPPPAADASGTPSSLYAVVSSDASHTWALGTDGLITATSDGGAHWASQPSGAPKDYFESASFPDALHGWAMASYIVTYSGGGAECSAIFSTTDGGAHWSVQKPGSLDYYLSAVDFIDDSHGWAVGYSRADSEGLILQTTNGGASWSKYLYGDVMPLGSPHFLDENDGFVLGGSRHEYKTTDGGAHWADVSPVGAQTLTDSTFVDALHGWAVGWSGEAWATTDGGSHWSVQHSGTTRDLNSVVFNDDTHGWAVGGDLIGNSNSVILHTSDGGAHWVAQSCPTTLGLHQVSSPDATHAWAVADYGNIISTSDGGAHWLLQATTVPTNTKLKAASSGKVNKALSLSGSVSPTAATGSVKVHCLRKVHKKWKQIATVLAPISKGKFRCRYKPIVRGTWGFYASYPGSTAGAVTYWNSGTSIKAVHVS